MRTIVALLFVSLAISLWAQSVAARGEGVDLCKLMRCKCKLDKGVPKCVDGPEECKAPVKPVKPGMQWPVCASNGKTYRHPAEVAYEACKTKNPLKIESWKKCSDSKPKTTRGHENTPSRRRARLPPHKSSRRRTRLPPHKGSRRRTRLPPHKGSRRRTRLPPHKGSRRRTRLPSRKRSLCSAFTRAEPHCKCQLRKGVPKCVDDKGKESCPLMMDRGFVMKPVTGDNGKHYQNLEFLALDSCKTNTPIKVKAPKEARH